MFLVAAGLQQHGQWREWMLVLDGGLSIVWGALIIFWLITQPLIGVLAVVWWIGVYALVSGIVLLVAAFRLRRRRYTLPRHAVSHGA